MLRQLKAWIARKRFERATARFDREIAAARKAHRAVRPIQARKAAAVHAALAEQVWS